MNEKKDSESSTNFIRNIINEDLKSGKNGNKVATRFPPEPNGYLHVGHAKSICLNFGIAEDYEGATCNLRYDDTNPAKEDIEYVDAIERDIKWLGFDWKDRLFHASDYFDKLYEFAQILIRDDKAFVCSLNAEKMREFRGTLKEPGENSPDRDRSVEENIDLFERMKQGEFEEGQYVLRVKIDMSHPNINMRDPVIYRIKKVHHQRTGDKWCIYPMYDYTHCISDALEEITHSLCTLEFEDHRLLYDWFLDQLPISCHPQQIEFARLNIDYTVLSKRKLIDLVQNNIVDGWDDPRMPTIAGMRRRGYSPMGLRKFVERIGVTKKDSCIELSTLEFSIREDLENSCKRVMGVIKPLKITITNFEEGKIEEIDAPFHPKNELMGRRILPLTREIFIDHDDFMENPAPKYFRLKPDGEVRLRYGYVIKCDEVIKDDGGNIVELKCTYDPKTAKGKKPEGRKVKGIIHWVSATESLKVEVRLYDRLFSEASPESGDRNYMDFINPDSLEICKDAYVEKSLAGSAAETKFQFERVGYFCTDMLDSSPDSLVFNRTVNLKDTWGKQDNN